ncbi:MULTISPECIES: peroxide stress protein YaaA [Burkholderia]|uniref:peroxide stress protein YaaA n=1 Tax=Burkholderia TaxID=32008 RepID=UPI000B7A2D76|nr:MULTISPECIES: peroxide stress protein YaaA [Burkholderia]MBY4727739.1 peroxide stress protein YaaA [Burkholderia contaminans]MCI3973076.1 peroxide stress protein YaaA [Burkholderia sp. HI4860]MDN7788513.1 peroxide stress protein YaaA [Burkholderia contaminans]OXJ00919.1 peroxide stress protein YaaA [Burkholderia sp. AU33647]
MIIVLSPAKSLDYDTPAHVQSYTKPAFVADASELIDGLRKLSPQDIATLMDISDPLARLNFQRYADWSRTFTPANAKQAVLAFNGDVYEGFDAKSLSSADLDYAQQHVRVLSGLYGLLRPLDLLQPYRLEMGTRFANARGKDLYAFWGDRITRALNEQLETRSGAARVLVNCASTEYFKSVKPKLLVAPVITPVFEDWKGGRYKIISFHAKRARGLMARFIVENRITDPKALKDFAAEGYAFDAAASNDSTYVYRRRVGE